MKSKIAVIALALGILSAPLAAQSAEITFYPSTQWYNVDGNGTLQLWGVPEANGNALVANPDYGWPTTTAVAAWYAVLLKAQEMNLSVGVGYDPNTLDIWFIGRPR